MIRLENLSICYGKRKVSDNLNAFIEKSQLVSLIGRNGAGKSTLLRAIAGLQTISGGDIYLNGNNLKDMSSHKISLTVALVTTEKIRIPNMRCCDIVSLGRAPYTNWIGKMQTRDREIVEKSLETVGMLDYVGRTMNTMSDGECQRIMMAMALAQETPIILLDEPTSFLDFPSRHEIAGLLKKLSKEEGKCVLFSTHELNIAMEYSDSVILLDNTNLYHLPVSEMKESGHIERLFSKK